MRAPASRRRCSAHFSPGHLPAYATGTSTLKNAALPATQLQPLRRSYRTVNQSLQIYAESTSAAGQGRSRTRGAFHVSRIRGLSSRACVAASCSLTFSVRWRLPAALSGACPTGNADLVGYGGNASCAEDNASTPAPGNTLAVLIVALNRWRHRPADRSATRRIFVLRQRARPGARPFLCNPASLCVAVQDGFLHRSP
ncbi:nuclease [Xanthomonas fragariae]|uniref:Nuclease n=1 Tax=Xanthomonas fragariae TaxID=48664 RepID=A0A1Y6HFT1_9XANT|nr:hypothetical protein PD885_03911 [Xanthomonas fragariae]SMR01429.1 nuclease [Xanthomonas fragariae]